MGRKGRVQGAANVWVCGFDVQVFDCGSTAGDMGHICNLPESVRKWRIVDVSGKGNEVV